MGFFNEIGNIWAKSQGAMIVQNCLLSTNAGRVNGQALSKKMAETCIYKAWEKYPDVFNGKYGRPHKLITALVGMTEILNSGEEHEFSFLELLHPTIGLLREIEVNHNFYPFTDIDYQMIEKMTPLLNKQIEKFEEKYGESADRLQKFMDNK